MRTQGWSFVMGLGVAATAVGLAGLGAHAAGYRMMQPVEATTCPVLVCPAPPPQEACAAEEDEGEDGDDEDEADVEENLVCPPLAITVTPSNAAKATWHYERANHAMLMGNFDEAAGHGKAALALNPGLYDAHKLLGVALSRVQRACEALDHYRTFIACNPQSTQVERIRAIIQAINRDGLCKK